MTATTCAEDDDTDSGLAETQEVRPCTPPPEENFTNLYGYLEYAGNPAQRIELPQNAPTFKIGRDRSNQHIITNVQKIGAIHLVIRWQGLKDLVSQVEIEDKSANGTYLNRDKIGRHNRRPLVDGDEVSLGTPGPLEPPGCRFIYRDVLSTKRKVLLQYQLRKELGKGSFATVYEAYHKITGQKVAVKAIHVSSGQIRNRTGKLVSHHELCIAREIDIMCELQHPNVVRLHQMFRNPDSSVDLVLEFISGGTLLDFVHKHNGLSEKMTKHILLQVCKAVAYIHSKNVAHRDLKPENVLLTRDQPPVVKIADFGLAKKVSDRGTRLQTMCGTLAFVAPEVIARGTAETEYDNNVDGYSIGAMGFNVLTNELPFSETPDIAQNPTPGQMRNLIVQRIIAWSRLDHLGYDREGYPVQLSAAGKLFLRRLLDSDPGTRMSTTDALNHPWLLSYKPYPSDPHTGPPPPPLCDIHMRTAAALTDAAESMSQELEYLSVNATIVPGLWQTAPPQTPARSADSEEPQVRSTEQPHVRFAEEPQVVGCETSPKKRRREESQEREGESDTTSGNEVTDMQASPKKKGRMVRS
ncbi:kinase-like domain-containing protein [Mycena rebaudengoi]|nr:kinase-like domain-containing protein [Mycena rebaudengoi]